MTPRAERPVRVLVVDDSSVARHLVTRRLAKEPGFEVVGAAASGAEALAQLPTCGADVVVLDEEMPDLRGRDVLRVIRREHAALAVVMFSAHVGDGVLARFEALLLGADDAVAKPSARGAGPLSDDDPVWLDLLHRVAAAARRDDRGGAPSAVARAAGDRAAAAPAPSSVRRHEPRRGPVESIRPRRAPAVPAAPVAPARPPAPRSAPTAADVPGLCVIASSTGGPDALTTVFAALPADFPVPVLVVQHMPPVFTGLLANRLDGVGPLQVREAQGGEAVTAGTALIAPGDRHLLVEATPDGLRARLDDGVAENSCRPSADPLLRSAVEAVGGNVVALVLSGMGHDGTSGASLVHAHGGVVIAQDEASSVVWGMPGSVVAAGIAADVLPLDALAARLVAEAGGLVRSTARARSVS